jgi:epoxyqueuosine reductase QueG
LKKVQINEDELKEYTAELEFMLKNIGMDTWGVGDLDKVRSFLLENYAHAWDAYTRVVSVGVYFPAQVVDELMDGPSHTYHAFYDIVNARLNNISLSVANWLNAKGYLGFPVPASQRMGADKSTAVFSHRLGAKLAGLGWIGKNSSVINPKVGPRIRFISILTDMPFKANEPIKAACPPDCQICKTACPAGAIEGIAYNEKQPLTERFRFSLCTDYLWQVRQSFGKEICGKCIAACPFGRSKYVLSIHK